MLILLITKKKKQFSPAADAGEDNDREQTVENFRPSHPALNTVNARDIVMENGDLLAPVYSLGLYSNTQN